MTSHVFPHNIAIDMIHFGLLNHFNQKSILKILKND